MRVVTVIVNFNRAGDTIELIDSIKKSDLASSELLVIDNGSTEALPGVTAIKTGQNLGFAGGYNFGMREALKTNAEAVLILNNDTLVPPVFLTPLVKVLEADPKVGAVSPKIYTADGKTIWWAGGFLKLSRGEYVNVGSGKKDNGSFSKTVECDYLTGACILFKASVLRQVGLFDERFTHTGEDDDLSIRIRNAGFKLLMVPEATLVHKVSQTGGGEWSPFHLYNLEKYRIWLMKKWGYWQGWPSFILLVPLMLKRLGGSIFKGKSLVSTFALMRGWKDGIYESFS